MLDSDSFRIAKLDAHYELPLNSCQQEYSFGKSDADCLNKFIVLFLKYSETADVAKIVVHDAESAEEVDHLKGLIRCVEQRVVGVGNKDTGDIRAEITPKEFCEALEINH